MKINSIFLLAILIFFSACSKDESLSSSKSYEDDGISGESSSSGINAGSGQSADPGLITAGEWNDLENWDFWKDILSSEDYSDKPNYWSIYTNNRISVLVTTDNNPVHNARVELKKDGNLIWTNRTDNLGRAELWIGLFKETNSLNSSDYSLFVNDQEASDSVKFFEDGINEIAINNTEPVPTDRIELSFIVDATGSMADELEFLKTDLQDVIERVEKDHSSLNIFTSTVFYRDEEEVYLVRHSGFTENTSTTLEFINQQSADGGGDFPEAVHTALNTAIDGLQWSEIAKTRIAFLLLDAPPHYTPQIMDNLHASIRNAAKKGIKLIPITASGIGKETEFLMRFFSISTNGTYVFITDHSGIGNEHLEPSVGDYEVEYLNDLMVRLINKYTE